MTESFTSLITMLAVGVICSLLCRGQRLERASRAGIALIVLSVMLSFVLKITEDGVMLPTLPDYGITDGADAEYVEVAKDAFAEGIRAYISERFDLDIENIEVLCFDFDFTGMRAELVRVVLTGKAVLADYRAIEDAVRALGCGECECVMG